MVLQSHPPRPLLLAVLDIVERHLDVWTATAALPALASALFAAHEALRGNGINERRLIKLLRRLGSAGHLAPATLSNLEDAFSSLMLVSIPSREVTVLTCRSPFRTARCNPFRSR